MIFQVLKCCVIKETWSNVRSMGGGGGGEGFPSQEEVGERREDQHHLSVGGSKPEQPTPH